MTVDIWGCRVWDQYPIDWEWHWNTKALNGIIVYLDWNISKLR